MIETPIATAFTTDSVDGADAPLLDQKPEGGKAIEADLFIVKQKPITSSIRSTIKHIKARGGRLARFRGLHVAIIYHMALSVGTNILSSFLGTKSRPFVFVFVSIVLTRIHMTWTHIVISEPSEKRWFRRYPSAKASKNAILPTAVLAIAQQLALYLPAVLFIMAHENWYKSSVHSIKVDDSKKVALFQLAMAAMTGIFTVVLIVIPADVTLKRVQASMLPEEDESIVPFDRTFGGKVVPEVVGGSGAVRMIDAWRTFDRSARIRLLKLYLKVFLVQVATTIMFFMLVVGELRLVMGEDFNKVVKMNRRQLMH